MSTMEPCVGKTYDQIWLIYSAKHGDTHETRHIHAKWKRIGVEIGQGGRKSP
jgi:hypothetical protein